MRKSIFMLLIVLAILSIGAWKASLFLKSQKKFASVVFFSAPSKTTWEIQSVDTMKYSRDLAAEKMGDREFIDEIERQTDAIANIGATHIAISTPYDEKFVPFLKLWVNSARLHGLKIWFRGNWSRWEGWFEYPKNMTREGHIASTKEFIVKHSELFSDGDIFSSCPECENGGPGDPRHNGDLAGHRKFIIKEYSVSKEAFRSIQKDVKSNFFSMNADVARLVMDKKTTAELDGIVVIDHYVSTPEKLAQDIQTISNESGGRVVLGEWGVPIPDINGTMIEVERELWMEKALKNLLLLDNKKMAGMNYWLAVGGTSALWSENMKISGASEVLKKYYSPQVIYGRVTDEIGRPIENATLEIGEDKAYSEKSGYFQRRSLERASEIKTSAQGYEEKTMPVTKILQQTNIALVKKDKDIYYRLLIWMKK